MVTSPSVRLLNLSLLLIVLLISDGAGQEPFFAPNLVTRAPSPQPGRNAYFGGSIQALDFDNDGRLELAVGAWNEDVDAGFNGFGVCRIISMPEFDEITRLINPRLRERTDLFGFSMSWGDADTDGLPELAVGMPGAHAGSARLAGSVLIFADVTLDGYNGMRHPQPVGVDLLGSSLVIADLHPNPGDEILIGAPFRDTSETDAGQVLLFGAAPTAPYPVLEMFTPQSPTPAGHFGSSLAAGDFDGDGAIDMAIGSEGAGDGGEVHILYGGSYTRRAAIVPADPVPGLNFGRSLAATDINGDGIADLAVGRPGADFENPSGAVDLILGPNFTSRQRITAPADTVLGFGNALEMADLDRDGRVDLIVGAITTPSPFDPAVTGAGEIVLFTTALQLAGVPPLPGDVNGDGDRDYQDIFVLGEHWGDDGAGTDADSDGDGQVDADDAVSVVVGGESAAADLNGDGRVNWHDLLLFGSAWQRPGGLLPGSDLNRDGFVDSADLRRFIDDAEHFRR